MSEFLCVSSHQHTFCIDISFVMKIIQLPELDPLPQAPNDVAGLMNYAGRIIPVYDLVMLMGLNRYELYNLNTMIVICSLEGRDVGLIVDGVIGQRRIEKKQVNRELNVDGETTYIDSVVTMDNMIVMIPCIKKIISRKINLGGSQI